jgi:hypothetical protein
MAKLEELLKEKRKRQKAKKKQKAQPIQEPGHAQETPLEAWKRKRAAREVEELEGGEIANMLEGLTPDGYDQKGRKVSFVERGVVK